MRHSRGYDCSQPRRRLDSRGGAADEEPLVYRAVDLLGGELLVLGDLAELVGADARGGLRDGQVGAAAALVHMLPNHSSPRWIDGRLTSKHHPAASCQ